MKGVAKLSNGPGDVELIDLPEPEILPGHAIVAVRATGICGTDLHILKGEYKVTPPVVIGHEVCGLVSEIGEGVDRSWLGKRVVLETFFDTCRQCRYCRGGRPNLCSSRRSIGTHVNGGMAPWVQVPVSNLHEVPDWLSDYGASLAEPLACVCNAVFAYGCAIAPSDNVLVIGPGAIGAVAAQVAKACGASVVARGTSSDRGRLDLLQSIGFDCSVAGETALPPDSFDVVIECSGNGHGQADALKALRKGGRLLQVGLFGKNIDVDFDAVCRKELVVTSGFASTPASWLQTMALIEKRNVDLDVLVTEAGSLENWNHLFDSAMAQKGMKYIIDPRLGSAN
ncbi:alcohol dehydrogenase catalytic domain-containing protein [Mesorhizobium sp. NZP2298]|uniref:alcohol dehydrogenase catalytic domain-containing protein n=1 Tax=Mesorhizobium sp. NZP2298 TaxID=2483403 RepID=UPI001554993D|nr:alcohol dehydrogenase catalytic domain-containing protein [Mesorhizobium sp. NZP2298]QKC98348.1 Zn-dependent alcohol dehydrogenase [Mesorhizobium sp. NZP2298]